MSPWLRKIVVNLSPPSPALTTQGLPGSDRPTAGCTGRTLRLYPGVVGEVSPGRTRGGTAARHQGGEREDL